MRPAYSTPAVLLLSGATITCRVPRDVYERELLNGPDGYPWPDAVSYRNRTPTPDTRGR